MAFRTDLAVEAVNEAAAEAGRLSGVRSRTRSSGEMVITEVEILDARGEEAIGRPRGKYITVEYGRLAPHMLAHAAEATARELEALLRSCGIDSSAEVMAVGLGNRNITPDIIGPLAAEQIIATRHLVRAEKYFAGWRPVSVLVPGVLGMTGIESAELVRGAVGASTPKAVIVIDALAAGDASRLCRTVQLASSGIAPGSGVGNSRAELSEKTLGVPVIAVGVPTVVDADTLCGGVGNSGMFVTPREIDRQAALAAKLVAAAVNICLHKITFEEAIAFVE